MESLATMLCAASFYPPFRENSNKRFEALRRQDFPQVAVVGIHVDKKGL